MNNLNWKGEQTKSLMRETQELLKTAVESGMSLSHISMAIKLPEGFLRTIMRKKVDEGANVNRVQYLYEYLADKPLLKN